MTICLHYQITTIRHRLLFHPRQQPHCFNLRHLAPHSPISKLLCLGHHAVPLIRRDLSSRPPSLEPVVRLAVLPLNRCLALVPLLFFYISHLATHEENPLLPAAISSAIEGRLGVFEDRMARLLFKQAVEQATMGLILAQLQDFDKAAVEQLRSWSVDAVKRTNGKLSLKDVLGSV